MKYVPKALEVFLNTGTRFPRRLIWAMGAVKLSAARANAELGLLNGRMADAIARAAEELMVGAHDDSIVVDVFQTGSGTGLNMNVNEVLAQRASELSGLKVHPNDHVNMSQSSNDVVPTAVRVALAYELKNSVLPALQKAVTSLEELAKRTEDVIKPGRTHLRDALPVTMGQEFAAYADALRRDGEFLLSAYSLLLELPLGGTAVGTGLNAHPKYAELAISRLASITGLEVRPARSTFRAMRLLTDLLAGSSALKVIAVDLWRLCQDLRLMYSGPFTGIGEVDIPQEIAGSSMMPGKVNPVTIEAVMQASSHVVGLDNSMTMAALLGEFELSMGITLAGYAAVTQAILVTESLNKLSEQVLPKVIPLRERARKMAESSQALITVVAPIIGYDRAAEVSRKLYEGRSIREALAEMGLSQEEIEKILNLESLVRPGIPAKDIKGESDRRQG
ncbi:MAG: lyase family protein [Acidilobaceae archaeon]|nr:lyase family protein [Acidilobaceae archaeon]MCX8166020.1 lyase family protein [Acidilobaceae archaeon]MDW7974661.1 lyase family protein [Sulfolobales archaeon]